MAGARVEEQVVKLQVDIERMEARLKGLKNPHVDKLLINYLRVIPAFEETVSTHRDELLCRLAALILIAEISKAAT